MVFSETVIVRPLFEKESSSYTYIVYDNETLDGLIIDPVKETLERDLRVLEELGIRLKWIIETHLHADHITSADNIAKATGANVGISERALIEYGSAHLLSDNESIKVSENLTFKFLATPGHTNCSSSVLIDQYLFTGDTLLIRGCGRTDFQEGSNESLFKSVREKIFTLDERITVFPGHNYHGEIMSSIGEEKKFNPRLKLDNSFTEFVTIMDNLNLAYPKKIDVALPANRRCGKEF